MSILYPLSCICSVAGPNTAEDYERASRADRSNVSFLCYSTTLPLQSVCPPLYSSFSPSLSSSPSSSFSLSPTYCGVFLLPSCLICSRFSPFFIHLFLLLIFSLSSPSSSPSSSSSSSSSLPTANMYNLLTL